MKKLVLIISISFYFTNSPLLYSQLSNTLVSISFWDYGPVAFDSFWRLPDNSIKSAPALSLSSKISLDHRQSRFFTQYFRLDLPLGAGHTLTLKAPYHYFNVKENIANELDMANSSGAEIGDIDIIFNIQFLKNKLEEFTNKRLSIYFTGEMHTAPTSRDNRQFIDLLKLLGTINTIYTLIDKDQYSISGLLSIGGGGWDDLSAPYQKHAIKASSLIHCKINIAENKGLNAFLGQTYIYAEGNNNKGIYWNMGFSYWNSNGFQVGSSLGLIRYSQENMIRQYTLDVTIPFKWDNNKD